MSNLKYAYSNDMVIIPFSSIRGTDGDRKDSGECWINIYLDDNREIVLHNAEAHDFSKRYKEYLEMMERPIKIEAGGIYEYRSRL